MRDTSLYDSGSNVKPGSDFLTLTTWNLLVLFCFAAPSVKTYSQKRRCSFPVVQLEKRPPPQATKQKHSYQPASTIHRVSGSACDLLRGGRCAGYRSRQADGRRRRRRSAEGGSGR